MDSHSQNHHRHRRHSERKRSRSPYTHDRDEVKRRRSRSPHRSKSHHHSHHHHRSHDLPPKLPFKQQPLDKRDFEQYQPLFADYFDIQKQLNIDELSEHEVKGRWKSFLGKWNKKELAEGWYDPETKRRADERWESRPTRRAPLPERPEKDVGKAEAQHNADDEDEEDEEDDGYGPALPSKLLGPSIPSLDELQHRRELVDEHRSAQIADLRHERKQDRNLQKERLEEMAPRADPGSRERQMEKKRDAAAVNREFKDAKDGGDVEVGENDLMGDDGIDGYKAKLKADQKKKNEREIRKEEVLRAREAEREERRSEFRKKEEKTMDMLRSIAKQRFG